MDLPGPLTLHWHARTRRLRKGVHRAHPQVAYLEPERVEVPLGVRQVLRDAHARLGGAKHVAFLGSGEPRAGRPITTLKVDQQGRALGTGGALLSPGTLAYTCTSMLRQARTAEARMPMALYDVEALQWVGQEPSITDAFLLEAQVWRLESVAWRQQQQRRRGNMEGGVVRWERRGAAGRRGRRRREPGVVFELGAWGEERRVLSHEEAARVVVGTTALSGFV